ncbi:MAG: hypothetical protein NPINA01_28300 [Nitrospinaceae bacterium]|nr:MAG: hypothetical protein NPINA01_28300 [Nitrospinaceae bacterium]
MSVGHVAANVPGLANEFRKSATGSDLVYTIGFGWQVWNFIWQGAMPPGFSHLEVEENEDEIEEDDEDDDEPGPHLLFSFSASEPEVLRELAEQSRTHLKNIADVHEMVLATPVADPEHPSPKSRETAVEALIGQQNAEYAQSSYLLALNMTSEKATADNSLSRDVTTLTENQSGLISHLYGCKTETESKHYLMAFCNHVRPFQGILDRIAVPSDSLKAPWSDIAVCPSLFFLPSLEILGALRMGTLRMGPLSPTARWK